MAKPNKDRKGAVRSLIAPLTPKGLRKEIKANTQLQFGDQLRDYGKQIGASKQQSRQINQWYGQYRDNVADIQRGQAASTAALQNQARAWDNTAATRSGAETGRVTGEEDRSAAIRGALPNSGAGETDKYAEEQRNALRKSYGMRAAEMGDTSNKLLGQFQEASFSGLRDDQRRERNIRLNIQKDRNATKKDMGAFKVSESGRLRGEERDWNIQNRTLNSNNRNAAAGRALDWATENRLRNEGSGSGGSGGGGGRGGPSRKGISRGLGLLDGKYNPMGGGGEYDGYKAFNYLKKNRGEAINYLVRSGVPRPAARAAVRRFIGKWNKKINSTPNSSGAGRPGGNTG